MLTARQAGLADLPALRAITYAAYEGYVEALGGEPPPMSTDYTPQVIAGETWMVARDGREAAIAVLEPMRRPPPGHLLILNLAVLPDAQGGGIGRWMLDFAEARARRLGLPALQLFTHPKMTRNIGIYGKAGYVETGRRPNPKRAGWILIDMAKTLS